MHEQGLSWRSLMYLYFDACEYKLQSRLTSITDRILLNTRCVSYDEAVEIISLIDRIETVRKISTELYRLLDGID